MSYTFTQEQIDEMDALKTDIANLESSKLAKLEELDQLKKDKFYLESQRTKHFNEHINDLGSDLREQEKLERAEFLAVFTKFLGEDRNEHILDYLSPEHTRYEHVLNMHINTVIQSKADEITDINTQIVTKTNRINSIIQSVVYGG